MSLTLRLALSVVVLLLLVVLGSGLLMEHQMQATEHAAKQAELRLVTQRAADELRGRVDRLRADVLFLAQTPQLQTLRQVSSTSSRLTGRRNFFGAHLAELQQLFLAIAHSNPDYAQVRLIGDTGREIVRVNHDRSTAAALAAEDQLQDKSGRYYVKQGLATPPGRVYLSRIDLNREHHAISYPKTIMLRAVTAIHNDDGKPLALVVVNLDMRAVLDRMARFLPPNTNLFVIDRDGHFLFHPDPKKIAALEEGLSYRLGDQYPSLAGWGQRHLPAEGEFADLSEVRDEVHAYAVQRRLSDDADAPLLTLLVIEPYFSEAGKIGALHKDLYLAIGSLLGLAVLLGILVITNLTRPMRVLTRAASSLSKGDYDISLPQPSGNSDVARLTRVFQRMIDALRQRERHLTDWNLQLERQVLDRTRQLEASRSSLAAQRALQALILDNLADGVVAVDEQANFTLWNRRVSEIFGMSVNQVPVDDWPQALGLYRTEGGDHLLLEELPLCKALRGQTVAAQEIFVRNDFLPNGLWISMFARPLRDTDDRVEGAIAVISDVQESHLLAKQRDARSEELARVGQLSAIAQIVDTAAHQLSQPLAAIANYAGAAMQLRASGRLDDDKLKQILGNIDRLAERGGHSLQTLRTLLPTGRTPPSQIDVNEIVAITLGLLNDRIEQLAISLETLLAPDLPRITSCRDQIYQALVHLLGNALDALDASQTPPRRLWVVTQRSAEHLLIRVGDNGVPVPAELHETIFEPWFSTKPGALGIGLSVVRTIAESHNGKIDFQQSDDGVTWFTLELPIDI